MTDSLPESSPVAPSLPTPAVPADALPGDAAAKPARKPGRNSGCGIAAKELPRDYQLRNYRIIRPLGSGGFGVTYLAQDVNLERPVVIKESFPNSICHRSAGTLDVELNDEEGREIYEWATGNFLREARLLSTLDHPNIARVYAYFAAHKTAYYITEYIDGSSLAEVSLDYDRHEMDIPQSALYGMMVRVLDALSYLHGKKLLHRDIKPDNILINRQGYPMLIDFGAAREEYGDLGNSVVESQGFSPSEQSMPGGNMGPWTDLYAFGATLYYILTNECLPNCRMRELSDSVEPLVRNPRLRRIYHLRLLASIDRAIRPSIEQRYRCVDEWMNDLHL